MVKNAFRIGAVACHRPIATASADSDDGQPLKCCSMAFIMSSGEISPFKALCMLVGQTRAMKSGVLG